jgi:leucyl aminopeptidase
MKRKDQSGFILLFLSGVCLLLTTCSKDEDSEGLRKESITISLNNDINADSLKSVVTWLQAKGTRFALSENHKTVAESIMKRFIRMGYTDTQIDSFRITKTYQSITYQQWQYNVIATLSGSTYPDSVCVIGAHYDDILKAGNPFTIVPGANDNASGIAALLEIARVMKKNSYSPFNTIEFIAFGSEELGLYGSFAYTEKAKLAAKKIKLMLNNDMIAYNPSSDRSGWIVNINDYDNSHTLRREAEDICNRFTDLRFTNDNTYNKQSDSYPFFVNGYKALFFASSDLDPNYHTLNDVVGNCNFDYCREIVKLNCALLVDKN